MHTHSKRERENTKREVAYIYIYYISREKDICTYREGQRERNAFLPNHKQISNLAFFSRLLNIYTCIHSFTPTQNIRTLIYSYTRLLIYSFTHIFIYSYTHIITGLSKELELAKSKSTEIESNMDQRLKSESSRIFEIGQVVMYVCLMCDVYVYV